MVDIRTLTIGSHVLLDGTRVKIAALSKDDSNDLCWIVGEKDGLCVDGYLELGEIQPIPITEELLEELGFEYKTPIKSSEAWEKRWGGTDGFFDNFYIGISPMHDGLWRMFLYKGSFANGQTACRYLHEAEAFLNLHNVKLIDE